MKPMYALHKDREGAILAANAFSYDCELGTWMRGLDIRAGDKIEFGEVVVRDAEPEIVPAFITDTPPPEPKTVTLSEQIAEGSEL